MDLEITTFPDIEKENADKNRPKVLVVDDNTEILDYLTEILGNEYTVFTAENGKNGLAQTIRKMPSLVISDIMMDGMDGLQLCSAIKTNMKTSHIPVILLTAKNTMDAKLGGFENGADAYIKKPFNSKLLLTRVRKIIEQKELLKKKFLLADNFSPNARPATVDEEFTQKVVSTIERHMSDSNFSIQILTDSVDMSQDQLYRKIKALTGLSINHFIRMVRLKRAASLLREERYTVSEVLYIVGFSNPSYFTKCFKTELGVKPSEYVKSK